MGSVSLARNDPSKYFQNVFGNLKKTGVFDIESHIDSLDELLFSTHIKSLLFNFVGSVFLKDDSTKKAAVLLERSLQLHDKLKRTGSNTQQMKSQFDECRIMLSLCFIRNYERLDEAKRFLTEIGATYQKSDSVTGISLCIRARLGLVEHILVHERCDLIEICGLLNLTCSALKQLKHAGDVNLAASYNCSLLAFDYNYLLASDDETRTNDVALKIKTHLASVPGEMRIVLAREILRMRNFSKLDAKLICSIVSEWMKEDHQSCVMANVHNMIGVTSLIDGKYEFARNKFKKCWEIYSSELGEGHLLTAEAKFQYARMLIALGEREQSLDPTGMSLMSESLEVMRQTLDGKVECFPDSLIAYAAFLSDCGKLKEAERYFKEAIDVQAKIWKNPRHPNVFVAKHSLGFIYFQYKQWKLAIAECIHVSNALSKEKHSKFAVMAAEAMCYAGYGYLKLGNISCAEKMLANAKEGLIEIEERDTFPELLFVMTHLAFFHFTGSKNMSLAKEEFTASFNLLAMLQSQLYGGIESEIYLLLGFLSENLENQLDAARKMYGFSLKRAKKRYIVHPSICDSLLAIAKLDFKQGKIQDCEENLAGGLRMACQIYGGKDVNVEPFVEVYSEITLQKQCADDIYNTFCNYQKKLFCLGCVEDSEAFASFCFDVASAIFNCDPREGKTVRCINLFSKSLDLLHKLLGSSHFKTAESHRMIGLCHLKMGNVVEAELHLLKSAIILGQSQ